MNKKINNYLDRVDGFVLTGQVFPNPDNDDIVEYDVVDTVVKTGEKDTDFIIQKKIIEVARYNRRDYLNSSSDEVGIMNILKKVQMSGDVELLNQRSGTSLPTVATVGGRDFQEIYDTTILPTSKVAANDAVVQGVHTFDTLPEDMKNKMSMADFVNNFGAEQLQNYLNSLKKGDE